MLAHPLGRAQIECTAAGSILLRHPALRHWSRDEMYDDGQMMAPGGLLLASTLADALSLRAGERVLDLGCWRGQTSILLASRYLSEVTSSTCGLAPESDRRRPLPLASSDTSPHCKAMSAAACPSSARVWTRSSACRPSTASAPSPGCCATWNIAQTRWPDRNCTGVFRDQPGELPPVLRNTDGWHAEYGKYHSAPWWRDCFAADPALAVTRAEEVVDGDILWEDDVLYRCEQRAGI